MRTALLRLGLVVPLVAPAIAYSVIDSRTTAPTSPDVEVSFVTDFSDDRRLVGFADDVFVGVVLEQVGRRMDQTLPETQFRVRVVDTVKGALRGEVIVNQQGGEIGDTGRVVLMEGDSMLVPGAAYLFATRRNAQLAFHTLVPGYGDVRIDSLAHQQELVRRFTRALRDQIRYRPS